MVWYFVCSFGMIWIKINDHKITQIIYGIILSQSGFHQFLCNTLIQIIFSHDP